MPESRFPKVGVGVFIMKGDEVLLGLRQGSHGAGTWSLAGGHLEWGENFEDCAYREVEEETGVTISTPVFVAITNDVFISEDKHYVTIFMRANWLSGEPYRKEEEFSKEWCWFKKDELPSPMFLPVENLLKTGFVLE